MRTLTDKIAAEHLATSTSACTCGGMQLGESYPRHVAEVTEAAVRAQIAADIRAMYPEMSHHVLITERRQALYDGMREAARIAEGSAD